MAMDILLVEDNKAQALVMVNLFAQQANAPEVHWVPDGYSALNYILRKAPYESVPRPDAVLLDLKLPRISGFEVLKELKAMPATASIPVIVLSAALSPLDAQQCRSLGADVCLSKPVTLKDYEAFIQRFLTSSYLHPLQPAAGGQR